MTANDAPLTVADEINDNTLPEHSLQFYTSPTLDVHALASCGRSATQVPPLPKTIRIYPGGTEMRFVLIPAGTFWMGSSPEEPLRENYETLHTVTITRPFYMAQFECTQYQWECVTGGSPAYFVRSHGNAPVEGVSWGDVVDFFLPRAQRYVPGNWQITLPTEAQWEYACRASWNPESANTPPKYLPEKLNQVSWNLQNSGVENSSKGFLLPTTIGKYRINRRIGTHEVGTKAPNPAGLYDMLGNVWEWCLDNFHVDYYRHSLKTDPMDITPSYSKVVRGGCFMTGPQHCRPGARDALPPSIRSYYVGFRTVLNYVSHR